MFLNYEPGDFVINPKNRTTVNFENVGKKVINSREIILEKIDKIE